MAVPLALPWIEDRDVDGQPLDELVDRRWLGTFEPAWSNQWRDLAPLQLLIKYQPEGSYMKGHVGYHPRLADAMLKHGTAFAFVYRDLRDVAVSATYHIENQDTKDEDGRELVHPGKEEYWALPTHADRLKAVITGLNEWPGLIERWELYAPWLDVPWVLPVRFEHMRRHPKWMAELFIRYCITRAFEHHGWSVPDPEVYQPAVDKATEFLGTTNHSFTYRKGRVGDWRMEFTPEIKDLFKERAGDWLIKLGYEKDNDW